MVDRSNLPIVVVGEFKNFKVNWSISIPCSEFLLVLQLCLIISKSERSSHHAAPNSFSVEPGVTAKHEDPSTVKLKVINFLMQSAVKLHYSSSLDEGFITDGILSAPPGSK